MIHTISKKLRLGGLLALVIMVASASTSFASSGDRVCWVYWNTGYFGGLSSPVYWTGVNLFTVSAPPQKGGYTILDSATGSVFYKFVSDNSGTIAWISPYPGALDSTMQPAPTPTPTPSPTPTPAQVKLSQTNPKTGTHTISVIRTPTTGAVTTRTWSSSGSFSITLPFSVGDSYTVTSDGSIILSGTIQAPNVNLSFSLSDNSPYQEGTNGTITLTPISPTTTTFSSDPTNPVATATNVVTNTIPQTTYQIPTNSQQTTYIDSTGNASTMTKQPLSTGGAAVGSSGGTVLTATPTNSLDQATWWQGILRLENAFKGTNTSTGTNASIGSGTITSFLGLTDSNSFFSGISSAITNSFGSSTVTVPTTNGPTTNSMLTNALSIANQESTNFFTFIYDLQTLSSNSLSLASSLAPSLPSIGVQSSYQFQLPILGSMTLDLTQFPWIQSFRDLFRWGLWLLASIFLIHKLRNSIA
jgi:hypothetical protein